MNNYASDGKSFNLSRAFLNETITFLKEAEAKFDTYTSEEKIMSYLKEDELQNYYLNLYKSLIDSNINNNEDNVNFGANLHKIIEILTNTQDIINLLKNNADAWRIENKEIIFSSESVMNDYNEILAKLKSIS